MSVSVTDKKEFIRWLLNNYQLRRRESVWILNYLMSDDQLMEKVKFVDDVEDTPNGMVMSTTSSNDTAFRFYYNEYEWTHDAERAFHKIHLKRNAETPIYIQINFENRHKSIMYMGVLENNPYKEDDYISSEDKKLVEKVLQKSIEDFRVAKIWEKIDQALDERNFEEVERLRVQLYGETVVE